MSFASPAFLWYFMPATLGLYWLLAPRHRNAVLALASLLFYTWGAGGFVVGLLGLMALNFAAGVAIDDLAAREQLRPRRVVLIGTVAADLSMLAVWKYAGFATQQLGWLTEHVGGPVVPVAHLALPIGISFFTFHHISYVVDVYRGSRPAQRHPLHFVTYIAMFPQLIAGPIVRYHEIADQLGDVRRRRLDDFAEGFPRFALGLSKKVVIADTVAPIANAAFGAPMGQLDTRTAWVGALAYTVQIYFDFSGYSDMAIGLGPDVRVPPAGELRPPLLGHLRDRLLAPVAHVAVAVVPRLLLHPARGQPWWDGADLPQPLRRVRADRAVARRVVDVRRVGALPRHPAGGRTRDRLRAGDRPGLLAGAPPGRDVAVRGRRLGALPRRVAGPRSRHAEADVRAVVQRLDGARESRPPARRWCSRRRCSWCCCRATS